MPDLKRLSPCAQRPLARSVEFLLFLVPLLVVTLDRGGSVPLGILTALGLWAMLRHRDVILGREGWILMVGVAFYLGISLSALLYGGLSETGIDKFNKHLRLVQLVPIFWLLRYTRPSPQVLWYGMAVGAMVCGGVAIYQVYGLHLHRAVGANNAIHFGNIALIMGFVAMVGMGAFGATRLILPVSAFGLGVFASLLSETRGSWLAIPALGLLLIAIPRPRSVSVPHPARRLLGALLLSGLALAASAYMLPKTEVAMRLEQVVDEFNAYREGQIEDSIGLRLEYWRISLDLIRQYPWFGVGLGNFQDALWPYAERGEIVPEMLRYDHAHNEFLTTQVERGLLGSLSLTVLFIGSLVVLGRAYRSTPSARPLAVGGMMVLVGYLHHGLTNNIFERGVSISFFVYALALILALIANQREAGPRAAIVTDEQAT